MTIGMNAGIRKEKIPKGYSKASINNYTPEQEQVFQNSASQLGSGSYLSRLAGGDQSLYDEMEAPALRQFQGIQGQLASRFSGMGMGGRRSSGFQNTQNQASSDFVQDLQSKRMDLRNQAIRDLMGMSDQFLNQRPQETSLYQKQQDPGFNWGGALGGLAGGVGGFFLGGPAGAASGASMGYNAGSGFSGYGSNQG